MVKYFSTSKFDQLLTLAKCFLASASFPLTFANPICLTWWQLGQRAIKPNTVRLVTQVLFYPPPFRYCSSFTKLDSPKVGGWGLNRAVLQLNRLMFRYIFHRHSTKFRDILRKGETTRPDIDTFLFDVSIQVVSPIKGERCTIELIAHI